MKIVQIDLLVFSLVGFPSAGEFKVTLWDTLFKFRNKGEMLKSKTQSYKHPGPKYP